jgi:hypothetical protein
MPSRIKTTSPTNIRNNLGPKCIITNINHVDRNRLSILIGEECAIDIVHPVKSERRKETRKYVARGSVRNHRGQSQNYEGRKDSSFLLPGFYPGNATIFYYTFRRSRN